MFEHIDASVFVAVGGVGIFLLGMLILTDGLKGLAGNTLRRWLARYTRTPVSGAATGAVTTALIQSSSATTLTAVSFVGAGLLTFPQALGIIFGANIGTTLTGWLVAIGGFKLDLGQFVLPLVLLGTLLRLFGSGRWPQIGWALAGFSLLFIGIEVMQQGMAPLRGLVTPADFPDDTLAGRALLVLIGVAITLITQSSSAGVATALVALGAGAISLPQAAAMVIGMDVGTTFTAMLATVGGSTAMRQTGYAHVIYNCMTGLMAFAMLGPVTELLGPWVETGAGNQQIGLVAFHTFFNLIGVLVVLPFTRQFAHFIEKLAPESGPPLLRRLDRRLLVDINASSDAALATIKEISTEALSLLRGLLRGEISERQRLADVDHLVAALGKTRNFVDSMRSDPTQQPAHRRHQAALHSLDHLARLLNRCRQPARIATLSDDRHLTRLSHLLASQIDALCTNGDWSGQERRFDRLRDILRRQRHTYRETIIKHASMEGENAERTLEKLDSLRWLHRVTYHIWRIVFHLEEARTVGDSVEKRADPALVN